MSNVEKLYVAYRAGYLGQNVLDSYFSFIANIIIDEKIHVIDPTEVAILFEKRYSIELPMPFIRQILGIGVHNKCFVLDHGKYVVDVDSLIKYRFSDNSFNKSWNNLIDEFRCYCQETDTDISNIDLEDFILNVLDSSDEKIISGEKAEHTPHTTPVEYSWYRFVITQGEENTDLYSFVSALSASNITKQALFFMGENRPDYSDLHVYLDSPIVFALLGMDDIPRTESYKRLIEDMKKVNCNIHVLDHNYQEVEGIVTRAATWATSTDYDLRKANKAARFFHDSQMNEIEISEFCQDLETKLSNLGITIRETKYDIYQNEFQENENELYEMIQKRYQEHEYELSPEREESIRVDVRSIIMIYRERQGHAAIKLHQAKHIMLTSNNAIANVSKLYESNRSVNAGHIPACVSADLFGAVLWLNSPMEQQEYQKKKLLADCYAFLKPDKALLDKYMQSLEDARNANLIDEKQFLFLRTHKVVIDSLMDITKGDYARFNSNTYREVYDDIQAKAEKKFSDEALAHNQTKQELEELKKQYAKEQLQREKEREQYTGQITQMKESERQRQEDEFDKKVRFFGWIATLILVGIPYLVLLVVIEMLGNQYSDISWNSFYGQIGVVLATIIAGVLFAIGKKFCFAKVRHILEKRSG